MQLLFSKYQGAGNDFIIADNRENSFPLHNSELIRRLCNRNFGIGADGFMLLEERPGFDFYMRYFNSDGKESTMCGNGGRCIVRFAEKLGLFENTVNFSGIDGAHNARIDHNGLVHLQMKSVEKIGRDGSALVVDTGSPHYVIFGDNISLIDVVKEGRAIRHSPAYRAKGINVNFVQPGREEIFVRTYERGVENETLSCGTGSVAAALCTIVDKKVQVNNPVCVKTPGGRLEVSYRQTGSCSFDNIWLTGPAHLTFTGSIDLTGLM